MNKGFEGYRCLTVDGSNLLQSEFARQYHLLEAQTMEQRHLVGIAVVHLSRGMKGYRGQVHCEKSQILDDEGINASLPQRVGHLFRKRQFAVHQNRIHGHIDLGAIDMCRGAQPFDVVDAIADGSACAIGRATDIDSIGTVEDGFDARLCIASRRKEFDGLHQTTKERIYSDLIGLQGSSPMVLAFSRIKARASSWSLCTSPSRMASLSAVFRMPTS